MIYVSEEQLEQVEYLISQSIQGNHVLFDPESIRETFNSLEKKKKFSEEDAYAVEHHIEKLILQPSLAQKKAYLEGLDHTTFRNVVQTYFNIVENNLLESRETKH